MNKIIVVTGTRKGLGLQIANYFLENGCFVYGCSRRHSSIEHENYSHYVMDVSSEEDVINLVRSV